MADQTRKITKAEMARIHEALAGLELHDHKIVSMHLAPAPRAVGAAAAADPDDDCHAVQMPNGHWMIVC